MKPPLNAKLIKATYLKDYIYRFEFSNGNIFDTNFRPMLYRGTMYREYLDVIKFKKMKFDKDTSDIYWGKNWDICLHIHSYYGEKKVTLTPRWEIIKYAKNIGIIK